MSTSERYPGYEALASYLKNRETWSYRGFLVLHRDTIIASSFASNNWKDLNNMWLDHFLAQARELIIDQEIFIALKDKTNKEHSQRTKDLEKYWNGIIAERNKDSINRKRTMTEEEKENIEPKPPNYYYPHASCTRKSIYKCFPINIGKDQLIGNLKEAIKAKKHKTFHNVETDKLKLWEVKIPDDRDDQLSNISLQDEDELLATRDVGDYWAKKPPKRNIHVIVKPPESTGTSQEQEQELIDRVTELQKLLKSLYGMFVYIERKLHDSVVKSILIYPYNVEFDVIVKPKRTNGFKWIVNIEQATLESLKETINTRYQNSDLENGEAVLNFFCDGGNYSPRSNLEFRNMLWLLISKNSLKFSVNIETTLSFSLWTFSKVCKLYGIGIDDPSLSDFPLFICKCVEFNDEKSQVIIKHHMNDLRFRIKVMPISRNEASRSQYVCTYLVDVANLSEEKFEIHPEKNVTGPNGHGPVDFGVVSLRTRRLAGITEVKDKDFLQGVAQNAVQCESSLSCNNQKVFGNITDAEKWYFLECSLDSDQKPKFKLSKPVVVIYGEEDMEDRAKKVLGHIAWLLEEAQRLDGPNSKVRTD
ncbi:hypothetical protein RclHR1_01790018 [Rhizophagus clarus]|uniref:Crinkler effector protein N-terminal domain-containing protein n=1 Tax=Rhizophagus clarus TaxID=94130 RepID=A0A2Z6R1G8_9GLOM|nr:hypothetical protein RclHR1_01790018 [Rhizophagus clarus]